MILHFVSPACLLRRETLWLIKWLNLCMSSWVPREHKYFNKTVFAANKSRRTYGEMLKNRLLVSRHKNNIRKLLLRDITPEWQYSLNPLVGLILILTYFFSLLLMYLIITYRRMTHQQEAYLKNRQKGGLQPNDHLKILKSLLGRSESGNRW